MINSSDKRRLRLVKEHAKKIEFFKFAINSTLYWDSLQNVPKDGFAYRSEMLSYLGLQLHNFCSEKNIIKYMDELNQNGIESLSDIDIATIKSLEIYMKNISKIPKGKYKSYTRLIREGEQVWLNARNKNDFKVAIPYLEKVVTHYKNFANYFGYKDHPYDAILNFQEYGLNTKVLDDMFLKLKEFLIPLLKKSNNNKSETINSREHIYDLNTQELMCEELLNKMGFDFNGGRMDRANYTTTLSNGYKDVRLLIEYDENNYLKAISNILHSGSQGLYEQGIDFGLYGNLLAEPPSMAIYEAVAKIYDKIIGTSSPFSNFLLSELKKYYVRFDDVSAEEFHSLINKITPSFIRTEADEVTYILHIIIRYEIEKAIFDGSLKVKDIQKVWNQKYKDYLGLEVTEDTLGVLQDIHWFSGYFGYFPVYVLGSIYATQIYSVIRNELPSLDIDIENGDFSNLHNWLQNHIFRFGSMFTTQELLLNITEENINIDYYIEYLKEKHFKI